MGLGNQCHGGLVEAGAAGQRAGGGRVRCSAVGLVALRACKNNCLEPRSARRTRWQLPRPQQRRLYPHAPLERQLAEAASAETVAALHGCDMRHHWNRVTRAAASALALPPPAA